jgi:hypothetical protein
MDIEFTVEDSEGLETPYRLPARNRVCSRCEGHGTHLNPSIGEHAYTREEFESEFDDEQREEYFKRGGIYDVRCEVCHGLRVVPKVDRKRCSTPELKAALALYDDQQRSQREHESTMAGERRMEAMMGGQW